MNTKMDMSKLKADFPPVAQMADYKEIFWINPDSGKGIRTKAACEGVPQQPGNAAAGTWHDGH